MLHDYNMVVTNNSYTNADDSCAGIGAYDVISNYVDKQMGDYPKLLHVFSAGNDGRNTCSPYPYIIRNHQIGLPDCKKCADRWSH